MKTNNKIILTTIWVLSAWWLALGSWVFAYNWNWNQQMLKNHNECSSYLTWTVEITSEIESWLKLMREEEKLARDVYLTFYEKYWIKVFANIANSEQKHMDKVGELLETYWIEDPILEDTIWVYSNSDFTELYENLVNEWNLSETDALKVWAKIEELDIADLDNLLTDLDEWTDIFWVYTNLKKWSINHLSAFVRNLDKLWVEYETTYDLSEISKWRKWVNRNWWKWMWNKWNWWRWQWMWYWMWMQNR